MIDRIICDHSTTAPGSRRRLQGTPELMALYARIGSASLFDCAWRLLPADEHRNVYRGMNLLSMTPIIELADGRMIAEASNRRGTEIYWVVGRFAPQVHEGPIQLMNADLLDDPADVPVYGSSLAMLLEVALETGGDISNLETSRLSQVEGGAP